MTRPHLINLSKISDNRGNLTYIQFPDHIPFRMNRVEWIYDVPSGQNRIGQAFKHQQEIIICISGSLEVYLTNGIIEESYILSRPYTALFIPEMTWRQLRNFSTNTVVMLLKSGLRDESEIIYDLNQFNSY